MKLILFLMHLYLEKKLKSYYNLGLKAILILRSKFTKETLKKILIEMIFMKVGEINNTEEGKIIEGRKDNIEIVEIGKTEIIEMIDNQESLDSIDSLEIESLENQESIDNIGSIEIIVNHDSTERNQFMLISKQERNQKIKKF